MPQAIVDPEELRRFASQLKRFSADLHQQVTVIHNQLQNLSATWRDQEQQRFTADVEQTLLAANRFVQACEEHIPFLLRKAQRAEEYLNQR